MESCFVGNLKLSRTLPVCVKRQRRTLRCTQSITIARSSTATDVHSYEWTGTDDFSHLEDRFDLPPVQLPEITSPRRVVLVRHGQSTWNAEGRIQGSTDFAVLSVKGQAQAHTTCEMVRLHFQTSQFVHAVTFFRA